jgi:hypothetical protein
MTTKRKFENRRNYQPLKSMVLFLGAQQLRSWEGERMHLWKEKDRVGDWQREKV